MNSPSTTISRALADYLTDWLAWVDRGAPDGEPYRRYWGLCTNAWRFSDEAGDEIDVLFEGDEYPFGCIDEYEREGDAATMHLNEARLAWVRSTLATAEIEG